ncbi:MAG: efflux RND transporter periplasmic adaptor subunit [Gemmatimonadaceae bacterium]
MMRRSIGIVVALATLAGGLVTGCGTKKEPPAASTEAAGTRGDGDTTARRELTLSGDAVQHGALHWAPVAQRPLGSAIEVPGQLMANEDRTTRLGAPAEARVLAIHVHIGDRVRTGQTLVTLESGEATTARADHSKALADVNARKAAASYVHAARERADRLLVVKAIPRQDVERAAAEDELAKSEVIRAEAEVARTRMQLERLGVGRDGNMVLRSSIGGIVLSRDAQPGAVVQPGAPLVVVSDPSSLWLDVLVSDRAASALRTGIRLRFAVPAYPADTFFARIVSVGGALDSVTRTILIRGVVDNMRGKLRAQMFATVWLDGGNARQGLVVPEEAVMLLDERSVVFVAVPQKNGSVQFERRNVTTGGTSGGMVHILDGLTPGEMVVTEGAFALKSEFSRSKMSMGG